MLRVIPFKAAQVLLVIFRDVGRKLIAELLGADLIVLPKLCGKLHVSGIQQVASALFGVQRDTLGALRLGQAVLHLGLLRFHLIERHLGRLLCFQRAGRFLRGKFGEFVCPVVGNQRRDTGQAGNDSDDSEATDQLSQFAGRSLLQFQPQLLGFGQLLCLLELTLPGGFQRFCLRNARPLAVVEEPHRGLKAGMITFGPDLIGMLGLSPCQSNSQIGVSEQPRFAQLMQPRTFRQTPIDTGCLCFFLNPVP